MSRARRIYLPRRARVETGDAGRPRALDGHPVEAVREEWVVEDRWWDEVPVRRHYFELALSGGLSATVFRDLPSGRWYRQRA